MPGGEFDWIARLRPLTRGWPEALDLRDDAALLRFQRGHELVVTQDAMVEGVHFLAGERTDRIARKLLRVNVSDLYAKGAAPFGYFLTIAWPPDRTWDERMAFITGLETDQAEFELSLLGGDTVSTPGPLMASVTMMGWVPQGEMVRRSGAKPGHRLAVTGAIGDGWLGLAAARAGVENDLSAAYHLPRLNCDLHWTLRSYASAAADVSDGLMADAGHLAEASGCRVTIDLDRIPLSDDGLAWLAKQPDREAALKALASGGDDYKVVCAVPPDSWDDFVWAAGERGIELHEIGRFDAGEGVEVRLDGHPVSVDRLGWTHG